MNSCIHFPKIYVNISKYFLARHKYMPKRKYCSIFVELQHVLAAVCPHSLMDRISDSGSDGCGSIPHEGTEKKDFEAKSFFYW